MKYRFKFICLLDKHALGRENKKTAMEEKEQIIRERVRRENSVTEYSRHEKVRGFFLGRKRAFSRELEAWRMVLKGDEMEQSMLIHMLKMSQ